VDQGEVAWLIAKSKGVYQKYAGIINLVLKSGLINIVTRSIPKHSHQQKLQNPSVCQFNECSLADRDRIRPFGNPKLANIDGLPPLRGFADVKFFC
jgi:hypothetical protein